MHLVDCRPSEKTSPNQGIQAKQSGPWIHPKGAGVSAIPPIPQSATPSPAERARKQEIASYLSAASITDAVDGLTAPPVLCQDANLTALVQLGAVRLDCDRAFLSLIDGQYQYVVSEATRTHSLTVLGQYDGTTNDRIYLGSCKVPVGWSVCPDTMSIFTDETGKLRIREPNVVADRSRYIIKDFRAHELYRDRPYVKGFPHMVSYAEVPLVSPLGYVVGCYCVIDNKPREFDNDEAVSILHEIASCIMTHLDLVRMKQNRARSEELIKGLGIFMGHEESLTDIESGKGLATNHPVRLNPGLPHIQPEEPVQVERNKQPRVREPLRGSMGSMSTSRPFGIGLSPERNLGISEPPVATTSARTEVNPFDRQFAHHTAKQSESPWCPRLPEEGRLNIDVQHSLISADVKKAFSSASTLIREAMEMDGLLFLDACPSDFASRSHDTFTKDGVKSLDDSSSDSDDMGPSADCSILAGSIRRGAGLPGGGTFEVSEKVLHRIIRRYPRGAVFSADEFGPISDRPSPTATSRDGKPIKPPDCLRVERDIGTIFRSLPGARSIIFLPLWHFQNESWYAVTLGWVSDATHAFDTSALVYLEAFATSIMTEVSRCEALAVSRSKSDFISSVSHELRSPLHGILASVELLHETITDPMQLSTLSMIESCGNTLLETMNHILDFAKINNHRVILAKGNSPGPYPQDRTQLVSFTDLSSLVQDAVDAVYVGQNVNSSLQFRDSLEDLISPGSKPCTMDRFRDPPVLVVIKIQPGVNWWLDLEVGAWKRIVMNLFGNSLKYTRSGYIEVGVQYVEHPHRCGRNSKHICFTVRDTGIGMSADYLKYRLFTPFAQENILSTGTGLGLSIVKQIVHDLGGKMDVQSKVGVGTRVRVLVPVNGQPEVGLGAPDKSLLDPDRKLHGRVVCCTSLNGFQSSLQMAPRIREGNRARPTLVGSFLGDILPPWLGVKMISAEEAGATDADFYLADGSFVEGLLPEDVCGKVRRLVRNVRGRVLLLCYSPLPNAIQQILDDLNVVCLRHPIGPKKLAAALLDSLAKVPQATELAAFNSVTGEKKSDTLSTTLRFQPVAKSRPSEPPNPVANPLEGFVTTSAPPQPRKAAVRSPETMLAAVAPTCPMTEDSSLPRHLLLVDDNHINLRVLSSLAVRIGCTYESASNGLEAVQRYKTSARQFDFVFMDISMPIMSGFAATSEIRAYERSVGISPTKIIALTGLGSTASQQEAFSSGADLFLTKPVSLKTLRDLLMEN